MNKKILTAAALTLMLVGGAISLAACNHKNVNVGTNGTTASSTDATTETKVTINTKDVDKDYWKNLVGDDHNVTITSKDKNTRSKSDKTSDKVAKSDKTDKATAGKTDKKPSETYRRNLSLTQISQPKRQPRHLLHSQLRSQQLKRLVAHITG